MSCLGCANTTVRIDRVTASVVAGRIIKANPTVVASTEAYYEPQGTETTEAQLKLVRRRALLVIGDVDCVKEDLIIDLADNAEYMIEEYRRFVGSHIELLILENRSND